ncbi:uncharacterized protein LOC120275545 [Dioscorea cayenensis subsp. rotundata]|uniref:Uncharacterized protein LOC120275545 n=1 Tax=Dioscorea cayennensis subsp. rotundata TaxID=55577 RepID=A0AB40CE62_DIOCR|nr:uncharacterized protein LOC120275545 [Dioscorea cayenensis subsp. rotundata]
MTLEDFFTLTEMKNGLATLARVEELIAVMQRPVDIVITSIGSIGDAARQWLTVAGTLSATDNNDCLHHFVNLNGVYFLNQWLQEAMKCSSDAGDSSVEELMIALLGSLARLPIDKEKSIASGIHRTVECFLGHKNLDIKDKARELLDQWNPVRIDDTGCQNMDLSGASVSDIFKPAADESKVKSSSDVAIPEGISSSKAEGENVGLKAGSAGDESEQSNVTGYPDNSHKDHTLPANSFNSTDANDISTDMNSLASSLVSNSCQNNFPIAQESSICPAANIATTGTCGSIGKERNFDGQSNASMRTDVGDGTIEMDVVLSTRESSQKNCNSLSLDLSAQKPTAELVENSGLKKSSSCISELAVSQAREPVDCGSRKYIKDFKPHLPKASQSLSTKGIGEKVVVDVLETSCILKDVVRSEGDAVNLEDSKSAENKLGFETDGAIDMELEYGEIDALEIARQIARKVEHEVVNYREPYCSSSPEICSSSEGRQDQLAISDQDADGLPNGKLKEASKSSEDVSSDLDKDVHDTESLMAVDEEPVSHSDNSRINFDLNAEFSTEENNCSVNIIDENPFILPAPKPVVATSKITSGLPVTPLHFEGESGWKGSAATSAFHPAPSRKTPDSERTSSGSKQKHKIVDIDLNAAGSEDDEVINQASAKHPTGDSSIEVTSRSTERVNLDLNSSINNPIHQQIAVQSVSPSSSSSSRLPLMRDFDLNDAPSLFTLAGSQNLNKLPVVNASRTCQSSIRDSCDIPTMSSRVIVEPQSYSDRTHQTLPTTAYGYNGFLSKPAMSGTALYRPQNIPYHDSSGTTLIPRWLNSGASSSYPMLTIGEPSNLDEQGPSRPSLDLNSCMEISSKPGSSNQFYQFLEEHSTASRPESSSGMTAHKRKEPDSSGYETYPLDGKQVMPSWL